MQPIPKEVATPLINQTKVIESTRMDTTPCVLWIISGFYIIMTFKLSLTHF